MRWRTQARAGSAMISLVMTKLWSLRRIRDGERRNATIDRFGNGNAVTLFFCDHAAGANDNELKIPRTSAVDEWIINLVEYAVTVGEPHR